MSSEQDIINTAVALWNGSHPDPDSAVGVVKGRLAALREQLAGKDARIAELEAELHNANESLPPGGLTRNAYEKRIAELEAVVGKLRDILKDTHRVEMTSFGEVVK